MIVMAKRILLEQVCCSCFGMFMVPISLDLTNIATLLSNLHPHTEFPYQNDAELCKALYIALTTSPIMLLQMRNIVSGSRLFLILSLSLTHWLVILSMCSGSSPMGTDHVFIPLLQTVSTFVLCAFHCIPLPSMAPLCVPLLHFAFSRLHCDLPLLSIVFYCSTLHSLLCIPLCFHCILMYDSLMYIATAIAYI